MAQTKEELLAKKREYARRMYAENPEKIRARNAASIARLKAKIGEEAYAERHRRYCKKYVEKNPEARSASCRKYVEANLEKVRRTVNAYQKKYRLKNPEICAARYAAWCEKNRDYFAKWAANQRKTNPNFVISMRLRGRLYAELQKGRYAKAPGALQLDTRLVLDWFEWLRDSGIVDWTADGIHIDHVLPVSSFDLFNPLDVYAVNHWTNLLPMTQSENSKKHASLDAVYQDRQRELVSQFLGERFPIQRAA